MSDPLRTAALREAVLAAWRASPDRFREDANSEEDHARGYYRDRVVVELAQNAADAAARAGSPGRLLLRLIPGEPAFLVAANTGAPLDAAGVASLASLRASAKRDSQQVGRFGVGFAAVRGVADAVSVVSTAGVHFSLAKTRELLHDAPEQLAAEVARRGDWLPLLRLPLPGVLAEHELVVEPGWDTTVVLSLRPGAQARVREQLAAVDDGLLLALPALAEITVADDGVRSLSQVAERWVVATRGGTLHPDLLADRPVEEQHRRGWQVTWAARRAGRTEPGVVHAPTPTQEPSTVPALLIGTFPLDPTRRQVAAGPLTDFLVAQAGEAWRDLLAAAADPFDLFPSGLPAGKLDAALRDAVITASRDVAIFRPAGGGEPIPARLAEVLTQMVEPATAQLLGRYRPHLVAWDRLARLLEVTAVELADVVAELPATPELYDAFATADRGVLENLGNLPVRLADGRTVHGARGLLVPPALGADLLASLVAWGIRLVDPAAAHPLLIRLGALPVSAAELLAHPAVRAEVADEVAPEVVRALVTSALPGELPPWLGEVLLPADDGEAVPARGLVLPGSAAQRWFDPEVLPAVALDWEQEELAALGVRTGLAVVDALALPEEALESLDGWPEYLSEVGMPEGDVPAVADLDAVRPQCWPEVLAELAGSARAALVPLRAVGERAPSYTVWWLRNRGPVGREPFGDLPWLRPAPEVVAGLDEEVVGWLGRVSRLADLDAASWAEVLGSRSGEVPPAVAVACWRVAASWVADVVPALDASGRILLTPLAKVAVADPMWAQHPAARPVLVAPTAVVADVAAVLDLDLAADRAPGRITSRGRPEAVPVALRELFAAPAEWYRHDALTVDGAAVGWWLTDEVHAADEAGLARALAARAGVAPGTVERLLTDPTATVEVAVALAGAP